MSDLREWMSDQTGNPNRDDYWTCCACYKDLGNIGSGTHTCPNCGHMIECTVELEPCCYTRLVDPGKE